MSLKTFFLCAVALGLVVIALVVATRMRRVRRQRQREHELAQSEWADAVDSRLHR